MSATLTRFVWLSLLLLGSQGDTVTDEPTPIDNFDLMVYLETYGYFDQDTGDLRSQPNISKAIEALQTFANIAVTGEVNSETLDLIQTPRCGLPDFSPFRTTANGWPNTHITYSIHSYTASLSRAQIEEAIADALRVWADVSTLTFEQVQPSEGANLQIEFGAGEHGDNIPFDGRGGVLAHAFLPQRGNAHFDDDENWTVYSSSGINLFIVAAHEFGHSLGLYHSDDRDALMYPYYNGYDPNFQLGTDDIAGIQSLYGGSTSPTNPPRPATRPPRPATRPPRPATRPPRPATRPPRPATRPPRPTTHPTTTQQETRPATTTQPETTQPQPTTTMTPTISSECPGHIDALVSTYYGQTYGLKGEYVYELNTADISPRRIQDVFTLLPNNIDAVVPIGSRTYFIKGCTFYRYQNLQFEFQSPLSRFWPALHHPSGCQVDAAMATNDGYYYFFEGSQVYKYRGIYLLSVTSIAEEFPTFPEDLRSGITAINIRNTDPDGQPLSFGYVFKGDKFYVIDSETLKIIIPQPFYLHESLLRDKCHTGC